MGATESNKIKLDEVKASLAVVFAHVDAFFHLIPFDLVYPLTHELRSVLTEYELLQQRPEHFLTGVVYEKRRSTALEDLRAMLKKIRSRITSHETIDLAIAEINFLLTAEILVDTDNF